MGFTGVLPGTPGVGSDCVGQQPGGKPASRCEPRSNRKACLNGEKRVPKTLVTHETMAEHFGAKSFFLNVPRDVLCDLRVIGFLNVLGQVTVRPTATAVQLRGIAV